MCMKQVRLRRDRRPLRSRRDVWAMTSIGSRMGKSAYATLLDPRAIKPIAVHVLHVGRSSIVLGGSEMLSPPAKLALLVQQ